MGDTICALASGAPPSAIAVIRLSGPAVADIIARYLRPQPKADRRAILSELIDNSGAAIDEGLAVLLPGPQSYTGEDTLELSLHGGRAIVEAALETLCKMDGVRLAEPGEFTRRAFENGKLDLVQAEGVADLIEAETRGQVDQASRQLRGELSETYRHWRASLLDLMASLEVGIDFPDEGDVTEAVDMEMLAKIAALRTEIQNALADDHLGERIRDGFEIAIVGAPNAGKSTLLNALSRTEAAIVTDQPGTTRDVVQVRLKIAGHLVWLKDTAGLRATEDRVEIEGIRRAGLAASQADLRLHLSAAEIGDWAASADLWEDGDVRIQTKSDVSRGTASGRQDALALSAKTGEGLKALEDVIETWVREQAATTEPPVITRARHRASLHEGVDHLDRASYAISHCLGPEMAAEDLRLANRALGSILGEVGVEDILGAVFSEFCIGK